MELLSGALSVAATTLGLIEPFFKKMKTVLLFKFLVNGLVCVNYLLAGDGYSGALICAVAILCLFINYGYTSRDKEIPLWVVIVHSVIFLGANLLTFAHWYDVFTLIASLLFVLCIAQKTTKFYRLLYIGNCLIWIPYDILAAAWGNLFTHTVLSIAILVSIILNDRKKAKEEV
ncbi:MAG: YgjV family protein [Ruminococcaceae bacterium]|nr:YgjV family protein [Oscillospiraceae bacterium]